MQIKICGLRQTDNIGEMITLRPDYVGMIFYPGSKRYLGRDLVQQTYIRSIKTVRKVGVFVNASYKTILEAIDSYGLDFVQLHGTETVDYCICISGHIPIIKAFRINASFDFQLLRNYEKCCSLFLFDAAVAGFGGTGQTFDWQLLQKYTLPKNFVLSGGISLDNIMDVKKINHPHLIGIDVNSCFETEPGIKDVTDIKRLLHEIRNQ